MFETFSLWLQTQKKSQIDQPQFLAGFQLAFPEYQSDGRLRERVLDALTSLSDAGVIRFPASHKGWDPTGLPRLPRWISVIRQKVERPDFSSVSWLPELAFALGSLRTSQLEKLRTVNRFLIENRSSLGVTLPYRERALEIFGDEKAFDGAVKGELLYGQIPLSLIGACNPEPPLAREDFDGVEGPFLLLENHHTYWSMLQWNAHALRFRSIGYGSGHSIIKASNSILDAIARSGATHIEYLGDLDPTGVSIAATLDQNLRSVGASGLRPARSFYEWMLEHGRRRPLTADKRAVVSESLGWFAPELRRAVDELFNAQLWVPQESLSLRVLHTQVWPE